MRRLNPSVEERIVLAGQQLTDGLIGPEEYRNFIADTLDRAPSDVEAVQALFPHVREVARLLNIRAKGGPLEKAQAIVEMLRSAVPPSAPSVEFVSIDNEQERKKAEKERLRAEREQQRVEEAEATARRLQREQREAAAQWEAQKAAGTAYIEPQYEEAAPVDVFEGQISEDDLFFVQKWMQIQEDERANAEAERLFADDPQKLAEIEQRHADTEAESDAFFRGLALIGYTNKRLEEAQLRVWLAIRAAALRMARRELRGRKDLANSAQELAAEAAIQAYFKLHHFKGRSSFGRAKVSTWVGSIVRNLARTLRERQSASGVVGQSGLTALAESLGFSGVARTVTVRVQPGDTVESLALRFYGTPTKAKLIRKKNRLAAGEQPVVGSEIKLADVSERGVTRVTGEAAEIAMAEAEESPWAGTYGDVLHEKMLAERLEAEQQAEEMARKEDQLVWEVLQSLPANDRHILMMRIPQGTYNLPDGTAHLQTQPNDYEYIGKVLGIAKGTVMSRLSRARNKVFEALGDKIKPPYFGELSKGILQLAANGRQGKVDAEGHVDTLAPLPAVAVQAPELVPVLATPNWPEWLVDLLRPSKEQLQAGWREKLSGVGPQPRKTGMLPGVSGFVGRGEERVGFYQRDPSRRRANPYVPGMESADFYYETPMDLLFMWEDGLINQEQYDTCMAAIDAELAAQAA